VEAERQDARNVALAVGALLVAIGLAGLVRPYTPVRGVDAIADLGVVGALAELADQLLG
jgi:hypothetical protein